MKYSSAIIERLLALGLTEQEINTATEQEIKIRLSDAFNETQNSSARIELEEEDLSDILDILEMNEITVSQSESTTSSNEDLFAEVEEEATAVVTAKKGKKSTAKTTSKVDNKPAKAEKAAKPAKVTKAKAEKSEEDLLSEIRATTTKTPKESITKEDSLYSEFSEKMEAAFKSVFGDTVFEVRFKKNGFAFFVGGKCVISFHTISVSKYAMTFKCLNKKKELFDELISGIELPEGVKVFFAESQYNGVSNVQKEADVTIFQKLIEKSLEFCSKSTAQKAKNLQKINEILKSDSNTTTVQEEAEEVIEIQEAVVLDNEISDVEAVSDLQFVEEIDVQVTDSVNESEEPIEVVIPVIKSKKGKK